MRTIMFASAVLVGLVLLAGLDAAPAATGGLQAVAVSPDGKTIVAGGENRALYVVDGESLQVKKRIRLGPRIQKLAFNKDGSRLLIWSDDNKLRYFDPQSWKPVKVFDRVEGVEFAIGADLVALRTRNGFNLVSATDGSAKGVVPYKGRPSAFALDREAKKLVVLTNPESGDEKKASWKDIPKDLKGLARKEFVQKNDGRISRLVILDVEKGEATGEFEIFYSSYQGQSDLLVTDDAAYVLNYDNTLAKIDSEGKIELFESKNSYNYARGISDDRKTFLTGGLRDGTYTVLDGMKMTHFKVDQLPGWPEYFSGFALGPDGTGYGVTTAYRLVKISEGGKKVKAVPIY